MKTFEQWQNEKLNENKQFEHGIGKKMPKKKNAQGGFDPTPEQIKVFKKVDLITLTVSGTNCGNCMYFRKDEDKKGVGYCIHREVQEWVTDKMCCAEWSRDDIVRKWQS